MFQHNFPENEENPLPPALPGEIVSSSTLHKFRLRQLIDVAKAYGISLPDGATKNEILPILITHERAGVFRNPPVSKYDLLRAEMNHDQKIDARSRMEREQRIKQAAPVVVEPPKPVVEKEPTEIELLRIECKKLGINSFGKKIPLLKQLIEEAKSAEGDHESSPPQVGS